MILADDKHVAIRLLNESNLSTYVSSHYYTLLLGDKQGVFFRASNEGEIDPLLSGVIIFADGTRSFAKVKASGLKVVGLSNPPRNVTSVSYPLTNDQMQKQVALIVKAMDVHGWDVETVFNKLAQQTNLLFDKLYNVKELCEIAKTVTKENANWILDI